MKIVVFMALLLGCSLGRRWVGNMDMSHSLRLLQQTQDNETCYQGSPAVLDDYPYVVSLRNPADQRRRNELVLCGGVLLDLDTLLTSAGCIKQNAASETPFNLIDFSQVNRTFEIEFQVAIAPYCTHGNGSELVEIFGYHILEEYDGWPSNGSALAILELKQPVSTLTEEDIPPLRRNPLQEGETLRMVGHGVRTNREQFRQDFDFSYPPKIIDFVTISKERCNELLSEKREAKIAVQENSESCVVVSETQDSSVGICNGDDGNPLIDDNGETVGVVVWWTDNICENPKDQTIPVIFADLTKQRLHDFIDSSNRDQIVNPRNISDGCSYGQTLDEAPYAVSIQRRDSFGYVHICGGVLIDDGNRVLTTASCIFNAQMPVPVSAGDFTYRQDFRDPESDSPSEGELLSLLQIEAALAPRCRHFNGEEERIPLMGYYLHPQYNGNIQDGFDIAILNLSSPFPSSSSFPNFAETVAAEIPIRNITDLEFFGWGAKFQAEAEEDDKVFWNNYSPAKQVAMERLSPSLCSQSLLSIDVSISTPDPDSYVCAVQVGSNIINMCTHDIGGPLVGVWNGQQVVLGLLSWQQDRECQDGPSIPEVFTNVLEFKEFILQIIDPNLLPPPPIIEEDVLPPPITQESSDGGSDAPTIVIIVVVVVVVIVGAAILFVVARRRKIWYDRELEDARCALLSGSNDRVRAIPYITLNQDVSDIYSALDLQAWKNKNPKTGRARRHSDLAASIDFMMSGDKLEAQCKGYLGTIDDSLVSASRGAVPQSPFILAAIKKSGSTTNYSAAQPIQRALLLDDSDRNIGSRILQLSNALDVTNGSIDESYGRQLITLNTPAREDFDMTVDFEKDLVIKERLGTGAFGSVYRAVWKTQDQEVAVKIVHAHVLEQLLEDLQNGGGALDSVIGELSLLARLDNPHIVKSYGGCLKPPNVCILLEFLSKGSLDKFIHEYPGEIPIPFVMRVAQGIAEGLAALHPTVVHRDLKPQNVLLDENYVVKLADFGMSRMKENSFLSDSMVKGTPSYIAPEVFKGENVDEKCDIYALGLIIWEMVSKQRPWQDLNLPVVIMARVAVKHERPTIPETCPPELSRLITRCWDPNPRERPSAHEVAQKLTLLRRVSKGAKTQKSDDSAFQETLATLQSKAPSKMQEERDVQNQSNTSDYNFSQYSIQSSYPEIQMSQIQET